MLNIDLTDPIYDSSHPLHHPEFGTGYPSLWHYHAGTNTIFLANSNGSEKQFKLFRLRLTEEVTDLLYSIPQKEDYANWNTLHVSADGKHLVASFHESEYDHGAGNRVVAVSEGKVVMDYYDPPIKLRFSDQGDLDMFFGAMHPDNLHYFFWSYGEQMLRVVHLPTGQTVIKRGLEDMKSLNFSPKGDKLIFGNGYSGHEVLSLPDFEPVDNMLHVFGYYDWSDMGAAINARGDLAVSFAGKDRSSYIDIQTQVDDWDSHLVMFRKGENGEWESVDAHHFKEGPEDMVANYSFDFKSVGDNIYFVGALEEGDILWMEFPSMKKVIYPTDLSYDTTVFFSEDATTVYYGGAFDGTNEIQVMEPYVGKPVEVVSLNFPVAPVLVPIPEEDWRPRWDEETATLDLSGAAIVDLSFLGEIPEVVNLILDDSDVLELPDLRGYAALRKLSLKESIILDFGPLRELTQLTELALADTAFRDMDLLAGLTSLEVLDLGKCGIGDLEVLKNMPSLRHLDLQHSPVMSLDAVAHLPLEYLDISFSEVNDVTPLANIASLHTLLLPNAKVFAFSASNQWTRLQKLRLRGPNIDTDSLCHLKALEWLDLQHSSIVDFSFLRQLPGIKELNVKYSSFDDLNLLSEMEGLRALNIRDTPVQSGLEVLANFPLEELHLNGERFHNLLPLARLKGLKMLEMGINRVEELPEIFAEMPELEILYLSDAGIDLLGEGGALSVSLEFLRPLKELRTLSLGLKKVLDLHPIQGLLQLKNLFLYLSEIEQYCSLNPCQNLEQIVFKIRDCRDAVVPDILSGLPRLHTLKTNLEYFHNEARGSNGFLHHLPAMRKLDIEMYRGWRPEFLASMPDLQKLNLPNCYGISSTDHFSAVPNLRDLNLQASGDLAPLFNLSRLRSFTLWGSRFTVDALASLRALRSISLSGREVEALPDLPVLPSLRSLGLHYFEGNAIEGLERQTGLRALNISECELDEFPDLSGLKYLEKLTLKKVTLKDPSNLARLIHLRELDLSEIHLPDFSWMGRLSRLANLQFRTYHHGIKDSDGKNLDGLWELRALQSVSLHTSMVSEIPHWKWLQNVSYAWLELSGLKKVPTDAPVLPRMNNLNFENGQALNFEFLSGLVNICELSIRCRHFTDLNLISGLTQLQELSIYGCGVSDLEPIRNLMQIRDLDIGYSEVKDISALESLAGLKKLEMERMRVKSFEPLRGLRYLKWIYSKPPLSRSIDPLKGKTHLATMSLSEGSVKNLDVLFPLILDGILSSLYMHDLKVKELPKGLKFERYEFIGLLQAYARDFPERLGR